MALLLKNPATIVWIALVAITLGTSWVAESQFMSAQWAVPVVFILAALKARLIILHYMELKHAPTSWRAAFEAWVLVSTSLILAFWFASGLSDCSAAAL